MSTTDNALVKTEFESDGTGWDWCDRGASHVEFSYEEPFPLSHGKHLGRGAYGDVYEAKCCGTTVAWKIKSLRGITPAGLDLAKDEIDVMKKLRHQHIVQLVGSYLRRTRRGRELGLLIYPVAICDLATILEDFDRAIRYQRNHNDTEIDQEEIRMANERILELHSVTGTSLEEHDIGKYRTVCRRSLACVAGAIEYLHSKDVKHKDIKPANILLGHSGRLWVADFGIATDFSDHSTSATVGGLRGTPRYFAPEVAAGGAVRRAADIFSLGCVFFEMLALCSGYTLQAQKSIRPIPGHAFHENVDNIFQWFGTANLELPYVHLMAEVRMMLQIDHRSRPTAAQVMRSYHTLSEGYMDNCCEDTSSSARLEPERPLTNIGSSFLRLTLKYGHTYLGWKDSNHKWCLFVRQGDAVSVAGSLKVSIEKVIFFLHPSFLKPRRVSLEPPFENEFSCKVREPYPMKAAVFLKYSRWRWAGGAWSDNSPSWRRPNDPIILEATLQLNHDESIFSHLFTLRRDP